MGGHPASSLGSELHIAVEWLLAALSAAAMALFLLSELKVVPAATHITQRFVLLLLGVAASSLAIARWRPTVGRWYTLASMVLLVHAGAVWYQSASLLALAPIPVLVGVMLIGSLAGVLAAACEVASIALLGPLSTAGDPMPLVGPILGVVATLGLALAFSAALGRISAWLNEYMEFAQVSVADVRSRRAELERTLLRLEEANRQLVLSGQRMALLRQAAEEAQRSKSVFVASVSHEFRTPLNTIMGLVELMMDRSEIYSIALPPRMRDDLRIVHRNCMHLSAMIGDVLDLTQIEKGRLKLHRERVDLAALAESSVEAVRPLLERKHLAIRTRILGEVPRVFCDRTRVRQVIVNLLSNAVRHTDDGEVSIEVAPESEAVRVSVLDTGSGIAPEDVERVFEPFYQGGTGIWRDTGGSGLGLSISQEFVRRHGGRIWLESEVGRGTAVHFTLPVSGPVRPSAAPGHQIREDWPWREDAFMTQQGSGGTDLHRPRVIVHDAIGTLAPQLSRYDEEAEFVIVPDAAVLDTQLQRSSASAVLLNSAEVAELWPLIDSLSRETPDTPILACAMAPPTSRAEGAGVEEYLVKPVSRADLAAILESSPDAIRRVLVVDDDPTTLDLLSRMIKSLDDSIAVRTASSGGHAIAALEEEDADLVFLDLVMAGMDGWEVLDAVQSASRLDHLRVVILSAQDPVDSPPATMFLLGAMGRGLSLDALVSCSLQMADHLARA
jgi:signal transduction histidine kinase